MLFMGIVFLFPSAPETTVEDMNYTVVVFGGVLLLSMIWYYLPYYGGVHWFTGPVATFEGFDSTEGSVHSNEEKKQSDNVNVDPV
jgi:hypothetical protein